MKRKGFLISLLCILTAFFSGCTESGESLSEVDTGNMVNVNVNVGTASRSLNPFTKDTPIRLYIYRRTSEVANFDTDPCKTVSGNVNGTNITFTSGDITTDGKLMLEAGYTYDFVMMANVPESAVMGKGVLTNISHGCDIMAGRAENVNIKYGQEQVNVVFNADDTENSGNLLRLASGIALNVTADDNFINSFSSGLQMKIDRVVFKKMPKNASFVFGSNPMSLVINNGSNITSYTMNTDMDYIPVTETSKSITYNNGFILPFPLKYNGSNNLVDIDFYIGINGSNLIMSTKNIFLPEIKPGYRYTFKIKMDKVPSVNEGKCSLYLAIDKWNNVSWDNAMGGAAKPISFIKIGDWENIYWTNNMGGDNTDKVFFTITGWKNIYWTNNIGGTENNGTNTPDL